MVSGGGHPEPIGSWHSNEPRTTSTEQQGVDMTVRLTDGSTVEVDDVADLDWSSSPFLVLRTEQAVSCLFQMDEVRSVTPRPPDPADSAVIPVSSLPWRLKAWCAVGPGDIVRSRHDTREAAVRAATMVDERVAREETATLARLVSVE